MPSGNGQRPGTPARPVRTVNIPSELQISIIQDPDGSGALILLTANSPGYPAALRISTRREAVYVGTMCADVCSALLKLLALLPESSLELI